MEVAEIKQQLLEKIKQYDSIIIIRHVKPDGDCMGSSLGLRSILRESFPDKKIFSTGIMKSDYLGFLGSEDENISEEAYRNSLVIAVDTATKDRLDCLYFASAKDTVKIDHHLSTENYASLNYVREDIPATCAILADFYMTFRNELKMTQEAARALFIGLVTDTGRFKYRGVSGDVMRCGAELLDQNLDLENIYANLYIKSGAELHLQGYILNRFRSTPAGVSYFHMTGRIQKRFGVSLEDASALVNVLDSIRGSLIWIFFIDQPDGAIRVRLRSRFASVSDLAGRYHGGGHKQAAGATVYSKREMKKLLKEADAILDTYKKENPGVF